jgi:hypothetical protein
MNNYIWIWHEKQKKKNENCTCIFNDNTIYFVIVNCLYFHELIISFIFISYKNYEDWF